MGNSWNKRNPERVRELKRNYWNRRVQKGYKKVTKSNVRKTSPEAKEARIVVRAAVLRGDIIRPKACMKCGREVPLHAHHPDHSKPLEVIWLCPPCHGLTWRKDV
jgi:hypothetical protein